MLEIFSIGLCPGAVVKDKFYSCVDTDWLKLVM